MKPHILSFWNAIILIAFSTWAYFTSETPSATALIPAGIGVILLLLNSGVKREAKIPAHIAVVLTLVALIGLYKPLTGALNREDNVSIIRVIIMMLFTALALVTFIRSFIEVRKQRKLEENQ